MKKFFLPLTLATLASVFAVTANAQEAAPEFERVERTEFEVKMNILASCEVEAADADFGKVLPFSTKNAATAELSVKCSKTTPYWIGLMPSNTSEQGAGVMASTEGGEDLVPYTLYQDSALQTVWGGVVDNAKEGVGTGEAEVHTVYLGNTDANFVPGGYSDIVRVAVGF